MTGFVYNICSIIFMWRWNFIFICICCLFITSGRYVFWTWQGFLSLLNCDLAISEFYIWNPDLITIFAWSSLFNTALELLRNYLHNKIEKIKAALVPAFHFAWKSSNYFFLFGLGRECQAFTDMYWCHGKPFGQSHCPGRHQPKWASQNKDFISNR